MLGRHGAGVFEGAMRLGERDNERFDNSRSEVALMGEISRQSGRPVSFGLTQSDKRPGLSAAVIGFAHEENAAGANLRPQTTARGVGILFGLETRTPFDQSPSWQQLRTAVNGRKLQMLRDASFRQTLINEADVHGTPLDLEQLFVLPPGGTPVTTAIRRIRWRRSPSRAGSVPRRRSSNWPSRPTATWSPACRSSTRTSLRSKRCSTIRSSRWDWPMPVRTSSQIMDASQPTFFLTYWVRERKRWSIEEAVRRLTSDTADLFGIRHRGRLVAGHFADVNVIDFEGLALPQPEFVYDFPNGAGRYIQGASGYDHTFVNGYEFMDHGEHTGVLAGRMLRSN